MIRAFVALDLPSEVRAALPVGADPPWRAVPRESLHVTLAFLGWVEEDTLPFVASVMEAAARPLAPLSLVRLLPLPKRRPRVLTVEMADPAETAIALQADLAARLAAAGVYEPEHRRWLPHVTIGRARGPVDRHAPLPEVEPLEFVPPSVTLYRSHLGGRGPARYEALSVIQVPPA